MIRVLYLGRKQVGADCLENLLNRPEFEVVGVLTDSHLTKSPTAEVARAANIVIFSFEEALKAIDDGFLRYDLGLSMLYWRRLKGGFLTVPVLGTINFHPAPLPDYKGTAGYNLALLEARHEWAVSAHYIDAGIDTGNIIKVVWFPMDPGKGTARSLERDSQKQLFSLFLSIVEEIISMRARQELTLENFQNSGGRYVSRAQMESMKEIREGDDIDRKIRAFWFPPYDGAYILMNGVRYTLVNRQILESLVENDQTSLFTSASGSPNA